LFESAADNFEKKRRRPAIKKKDRTQALSIASRSVKKKAGLP
jgi:hypothetical protein